MYIFADDPFNATFSKHHHSESYLHHSSLMETSCDEQIYSSPSLGSQSESDLQLTPMKSLTNTPTLHSHGTEKLLQSSGELPEVTEQKAAPTLVLSDESHAIHMEPSMSVYQHSSSHSEDNTVTAEIMNTFLPDLVTAISDYVHSVSGQCLAQGLITESTYKKVLESGGTSADRARTLTLAVKRSTETDSVCLEIFLNILEQELLHANRKLLSEIRKEVTEKANTCRAVVTSAQAILHLPPGELAKQSAQQQSSLLERYEYLKRQLERVCAEKNVLEARLKVKSEKYERLKEELETLREQYQEAANTQSSIKIENLPKRLEEIWKTIEERGMQAKQGRNTVITIQTKKQFDNLVQQNNCTKKYQKRMHV